MALASELRFASLVSHQPDHLFDARRRVTVSREILQPAGLMTHDAPRLNDTPYTSQDYTRQRRMRSLAVEVTGTEERVVKRAAVPELEASSNSSRPNTLTERESTMPALARACTTATLPRIKRFKFASIGEYVNLPPLPATRCCFSLEKSTRRRCIPVCIAIKLFARGCRIPY